MSKHSRAQQAGENAKQFSRGAHSAHRQTGKEPETRAEQVQRELDQQRQQQDQK